MTEPSPVRWRDVEADAPELAAAARHAFEAHKHKILGTLRSDGSPRLSGIEMECFDGDVWLGMMSVRRY
jgi:hypothetical protein